jgi:DDE superfamily endonuclease/helix-turn-helix, Psq domain
MVRTWKRTTARQNWDSAAMAAAIDDVKAGRMGYKAASTLYGVPKTTIERRVKNKNKFSTGDMKILGAKRRVFSDKMENDLVRYILRMEELFFGLTLTDVRRLAFQLADHNSIANPFNKSLGLAGEDWANNFLHRHKELSIRSPEATSAARARGFNRITVGEFFTLLEKIQDEHHFCPTRVFNVDETGLTTVQGKPSKIVALRGKKQVGALTSAERGQLCTVEICMSAAGQFIPPLIIFPRQRMKNELMDGTPPGCIYKCHPSGWMQTDIFTEWFQHFIVSSASSVTNPSLLILDGHATHTKNLAVIDLARLNGVTLLVLPPHCSHRLQPLDVSFMKPLSTFYNQECEKWLRSHPGRVITMFQIGAVFGSAYIRAATPEVAISGFRATGIFPLNRDVFSDSDFAPSDVTDQPMPQSSNSLEEALAVNTNDHSVDMSLAGTAQENVCIILPDESVVSVPVYLETSASTSAVGNTAPDHHASAAHLDTSAGDIGDIMPVGLQSSSPAAHLETGETSTASVGVNPVEQATPAILLKINPSNQSEGILLQIDELGLLLDLHNSLNVA